MASVRDYLLIETAFSWRNGPWSAPLTALA
jgi:hypothetical protein